MARVEMLKITLSTDCRSLLGVLKRTVGAQVSPRLALALPGHLIDKGLSMRSIILCEVSSDVCRSRIIVKYHARDSLNLPH